MHSIMDYVVFEIGTRQYLARPDQVVEVDKLPINYERALSELRSSAYKMLTIDKILLLVGDGKVEIGRPYLKKTLTFKVLDEVKKPKVRVATYKAKTNFRRVKGGRRVITRIRLAAEGTL